MKILWLIISVWTGGDGNDLYIFDKPKFDTESHCISYVKKEFFLLNDHVNYVHRSPNEEWDRFDTPNLFFCIRSDKLKDKIFEIEKGQEI